MESPPISAGKPASSEAAETATQKDTGRKTYQAPNWIVLWDKLKDVVDNNLGPCSKCKSSTRCLVQDKSVTFNASFSVHCIECKNNEKQLYHNVKYETEKIKNMKRKNKREKKKYRTAQLALNHKQRKLASISLNRSTTTVNEIKEKAVKSERREFHALNYEINICACLAAFYIGTGGYDIGSVASFLGVPGGRSFERTFHRHSKFLHSTIMRICKDATKKAFYEEVAATIKDKIGDKYSDDEIKNHTNNIMNKKYQDSYLWIK